jgi:hypothetical protein
VDKSYFWIKGLEALGRQQYIASRPNAASYTSTVAYTSTDCTQLWTVWHRFVVACVRFCVHFGELYAEMDVYARFQAESVHSCVHITELYATMDACAPSRTGNVGVTAPRRAACTRRHDAPRECARLLSPFWRLPMAVTRTSTAGRAGGHSPPRFPST